MDGQVEMIDYLNTSEVILGSIPCANNPNASAQFQNSLLYFLNRRSVGQMRSTQGQILVMTLRERLPR